MKMQSGDALSNRHLRSANLLTRLLALNERQLNVNDDDDNDDNDGCNESFSVDDDVSSNNVDEGVGVVDTTEESIDPSRAKLVTTTKGTSTERLTMEVTSSQKIEKTKTPPKRMKLSPVTLHCRP